MAPGPKKKSFHTPRNSKSVQNNKVNDKSNSESPEPRKILDKSPSPNVESEATESKKYSKRSLENNWVKYKEPPNDPHGDSKRGKDFEVLLSYSGGSGSQLKLQDEKDWEDENLNMKDISLNFQDLVNSMKCIPFHERINLQNVFGEKNIINFVSCAEKWKTSYKSKTFESKELKIVDQLPSEDLDLNIIEEHDSPEPEDFLSLKNFTVQDKTENIINALASNLTFKELPEKVIEIPAEENKPEAVSNDLDFLLSLNISSKVSVQEERKEASKTTNVDDWLDSILDD